MAIIAIPLSLSGLILIRLLCSPNDSCWALVFSPEPSNMFYLLLENFAIWAVPCALVYATTEILAKAAFAQSKFNPKYTSQQRVYIDVRRSAGGVIIGSLLEFALQQGYQAQYLPHFRPEFMANQGFMFNAIALPLFLFAWGDAHFYWTHRLLHSPRLYRSVHKVHHEATNPTPWSGLSMHWFEHCIYFSSAAVVALVVPFWAARMMCKGLLILPLEGHSGYGTWRTEGSYNHYIHHAKFNWNFGSSPLWDRLAGTRYPGRIPPPTS